MAESNLPSTEPRNWPTRIRELQILRRTQLTPRTLRLTLGGPNHVGFESHIADEHVKILFPDAKTGVVRPPVPNGDRLSWPRPMPTNRDYTVRRYDPAAGEIDIDIVRHAGGVASDWAENAEIGSSVWVAGPPRGVYIPDTFTWQAYLGDETAIPAIARRVKELPEDMTGVIVIEVQDATDEQELGAPAGMEVRWLHRGDRTDSLIAAELARIEIPAGGHSFAWLGGENHNIKPLRAWLKAAGVPRSQFHITGYWRRGATFAQIAGNPAMHAIKHVLRIDH